MSHSMSFLALAVVAAAGLVCFASMNSGSATAADAPVTGQIVHDVYFTLKDKSPVATQKMVDACKKYLAPQPGVVYFAVGVVEPSLDREVNDRNWDVGLHIVFKDLASQNVYQKDAQHEKFIAENKENWEKVRVFDTTSR